MWLALPLLLSCAQPVGRSVELSWQAADSHLTESEARIGLDWALSLLGAAPPTDGSHVDDWRLDLREAGFPRQALKPLDEAKAELQGATDVGRFLMRTVYEPWRYYAITGACETLDQWSDAHLLEESLQVPIDKSFLVDGHRTIRGNAYPTTLSELAFRAESGSDDFEVIDYMPNGQQRYAIYDESGTLIPAAVPELRAGQPGKCAWCHEGTFIAGDPDNPGFEDWLTEVATFEQLVADERAQIDSAVDYGNRSAHTYGELLVI